MKGKQTDRVFLIFLILLIVLVVYVLYYYFVLVIPQKAQKDFGMPDPKLEFSQRVVYAVRLELQKGDLLQPVNINGKEDLFTIAYGETATDTAMNLNLQGLIYSADSFTDLMIYLGNDARIQAGIYALSPAMSALDIANHIVDSNPEDVVFSFLAGWRAEEIAGLLPLSGLDITYGDFLAEVQEPSGDYPLLEDSGADSLEGFLFPDEYQILRSADPDYLTAALVHGFNNQLPAGFETKLEEKGLTLYEGMILASIIQKEMVLPEEGSIIASVFLNRLAVDMPLQSDPTVQYALGYDEASSSWWKNPLTSADLEVESLYNTYHHEGLPPAPICNPGMTALMAVVNAENTDYLYFRAACDGSGRHVFSETYEEHLAAACE